MSATPDSRYNLEKSFYRNVEEVFHADYPELLGKYVVAISCHDVNLCHNVITGRLITIFLHFVNNTTVK